MTTPAGRGGRGGGHSLFGWRTEMQPMLGNAVPSLIAEVLAREIRRQFFGAALAAPLRLLPVAYRPLIGTHAAHPGAGRGCQAVVRMLAAE